MAWCYLTCGMLSVIYGVYLMSEVWGPLPGEQSWSAEALTWLVFTIIQIQRSLSKQKHVNSLCHICCRPLFSKNAVLRSFLLCQFHKNVCFLLFVCLRLEVFLHIIFIKKCSDWLVHSNSVDLTASHCENSFLNFWQSERCHTTLRVD